MWQAQHAPRWMSFPFINENPWRRQRRPILSKPHSTVCLRRGKKRNDLFSWNHTGNCLVASVKSQAAPPSWGRERLFLSHQVIYFTNTAVWTLNVRTMERAVIRQLPEVLRGELPRDCFDSGRANMAHGHERTGLKKKKKRRQISVNLPKDNSITFHDIWGTNTNPAPTHFHFLHIPFRSSLTWVNMLHCLIRSYV